MDGYYSESRRAERVGELFSSIARRYDLINDLQSFGLHRRWKKKLIGLADVRPGEVFLDLASGTGDLVRIGLNACPSSRWAGLDFSRPMLLAGETGAARIQADALRLPVRDRSLDGLTMAYGMRNLADRAQGMREAYRCLKPGGRFLLLEFAKPDNRLLRAIYLLWLRTVQPLLGWIFLGDAEAYRYIARSLEAYPEVVGVGDELRKAGFSRVVLHPLFGGMMSIHTAHV